MYLSNSLENYLLVSLGATWRASFDKSGMGIVRSEIFPTFLVLMRSENSWIIFSSF